MASRTFANTLCCNIARTYGQTMKRSFTRSSMVRDNPKITGDPNLITPNKFTKFILVNTGRYAKKEDIPEQVTVATMRKAKDLFRIRVSIGMLVFAAFAGAYMMMLGRRDMRSGDSLQSRGYFKIKALREQGEKEERERKQAAKSA